MKTRLKYEKFYKEVLKLDSPKGTEILVKHGISVGMRTKNGGSYDNIFTWRSSSYSDHVTIKPKNINIGSTGEWIVIESRRFKNSFNANNDFESYNKYQLTKHCFVYMIEALKDIQKVFENVSDLFIYKDEVKRNFPMSLNPKYNEKSWMITSWGKSSAFLSMKPTVLVENDTNYVGIKFACDKGEIGVISYDQFLLFSATIRSLIKDFYLASLLLYNTAINFITLEETFDKDE